MIRPAAKVVLHVVAGVIGAGAVLIAVALWRLSAGPISLAFLAPYVEEAVSAEDSSYRVLFDDLILAWAGWERTLDIRALGVRALSADGLVLARVPEMAVELSMPALARGIIAPTRLDLFGVDLRLVREVDGTIALGVGNDEGRSRFMLGQLLADFLAPPRPDRAMGRLERVTIRGGRLVVDDALTEAVWAAPAADIVLERRQKGIHADLDLALDLDGARVDLRAATWFDSETRLVEADIRFSPIEPARLARITPALAALDGINLPLAGRVSVTADTRLRVRKAAFDLAGGPGTLLIPGLTADDQPDEIDRIEVKGALAEGAGELRIDRLRVDYGGGPRLELVGKVKGDWRAPDLVVDLALENLTVADLARFWPPSAVPSGRRWVLERVLGGDIRRLTIKLDMRPDDWQKTLLNPDNLSGSFVLENGVIDYFPGLPVAEALTADGRFDADSVRVNFDSGRVQAQTIEAARVDLTGFDRPEEIGKIEIASIGPLDDLLRILAFPDLQFTQRLGLEPSSISGQVKSDLTLTLPLVNDLDFDDISVQVGADLSDVSIAGAVLPAILSGLVVTNGHASMMIDKAGLDLSGDIAIGGVPLQVAWRENFDSQAADFTGRLDLSGRFDDAQRARWGFADERLSGVIDAETRLIYHDGETASATVMIDATPAAIALPSLGWRKAPGTPARGRADIDLTESHLVAIRSFDVSSQGLRARGYAALDADGGFSGLVFDLLQVGQTRLGGRVKPREDGGYDFRVMADRLDLRPLGALDATRTRPPMLLAGAADEIIFNDGIRLRGATGRVLLKPDGGYEISVSAQTLDLREHFAAAAEDGASEDGWNLPPTIISGSVRNVLIDDKFALHDLHGNLRYDGADLRSAQLDAVLGENQNVTFRIDDAGTTRNVSITSDNAGAALHALDLSDNVVGGKLRLTAVIDDDQAGQPMAGDLVIDEFHVVDTPLLADLLTIATLTGAVELLGGDGLPFDRLHAPFVYQDDKLLVTKARASGLSLGLTLNGTVSLDDNVADLDGTIIPAYMLNSAVGHIPVIGDLLTGGEGGGVFAATYRVQGPLDNAKITVNPLAALTPGVLRDLFTVFDGKAGAPAAQ